MSKKQSFNLKCKDKLDIKHSVIMFFIIMLSFLCFIFMPTNKVYAEGKITTTEYYVNEGYVIKIKAETTVEQFLNNIIVNARETLKVYDNGKEAAKTKYIKTGMELKVGSEESYILVVRGDVHPDGKLTATDLSKLKQYYVGTHKLLGPEIKAADINQTNTITMLDLSQLKMLLVGLELPELKTTTGNIVIEANTEEPAKEVKLKISVKEDAEIDYDKILVSVDEGETFKIYNNELKVLENTDVKIKLTKDYIYYDYEIIDKTVELPAIKTEEDEDGKIVEETYEEYMERLVKEGYAKKHTITEDIMIEETTYIVNNIDNIAPDEFAFIAEKTTNSITITAEKNKDTAKDYLGNIVEDGIAGIKKYEYRISGTDWQTENVFTNLTKNTEYTIYVRAIDYAGNIREASNNGLKVKTDNITVSNSDIEFEYSNIGFTNQNITVKFICDEIEGTNLKIQYQINGTNGEWIDGNNYIVRENCTIYARIVDDTNQESGNNYVSTKVTNIDKLPPLSFTPVITDKTNTNIKIEVNARDAAATETNANSGIVSYKYFIIDTEGIETISKEQTSNKYNFTNLDLENKGYYIYVEAKDNAGNITISEGISAGNIPTGGLGINNQNPGPENVTVNGLDFAYYNPAIPEGFRAINTDDASWEGVMPEGWKDGLVIQDEKGNQFVWIPVDDSTLKYEKGTMVWDYGDSAEWSKLASQIKGDELPTALKALNEKEKAQIEKYEGFYVSRYEIGNDEGVLGSQEGLKVVNGVTYSEAKTYAESMYRFQNAKSGLLTGTMWDTMTKWISNEKGEPYVTNNVNAGNTYETAFTFSGTYATGPNNVSEKRSAYKEGTNVSKKAKTRTLLTTGIVDNFKVKNIYDTAGNVWEYTSEYLVNEEGKTQHIARGGNYYWAYDKVVSAGAAVREFISEKEGEKRNEGGFRVALFLVEGEAELGTFEDFNRTINGEKKSTYKNPVIPAGFAAVNDGADWGNGRGKLPEWKNGLVIEDKNGNQFVWVPVDDNEIKYEKWTTIGISHKETTGDDLPSILSTWGENEKTQVEKYGGFYIARYESSLSQEGKVQSQADKEVLVNKTYDEMKTLSESMEIKEENEKYTETGLVTGTQWDTVMRWLTNTIGENLVLNDSKSFGTYGDSISKTGVTAVKNIYDLAGNAWEITAEKVGEDNRVYRGGVYSDKTVAVAYRGSKNKAYLDRATGFRMVLYVTGDIISKVTTVPVQDDIALNGTKGSLPIPSANGNVTITPSTTSWTNKDITVTLKNANADYYMEYQKNSTTGTWIRIDSNSTLTISNNCTIYARLTNSKKQGGATINYVISNIDKTAPNTFTPSATNVTSDSITIQANTTDNLSRIDFYKYYVNGLLVYTGTSTLYTKTNLSPVTNYNIYVIAVDKAGNERTSNTISVKTKSKGKIISQAVKIGDYVNYDAGNWTEADFTKITNSYGNPTVNKSKSLPKSNRQFGRFCCWGQSKWQCYAIALLS